MNGTDRSRERGEGINERINSPGGGDGDGE